MNLKFESGLSWWLNPFCGFMFVEFLWHILRSILSSFFIIPHATLTHYDDGVFAIAGFSALMFALVTRKKVAVEKPGDKWIQAIAVLVCLGLMVLGLVGFFKI